MGGLPTQVQAEDRFHSPPLGRCTPVKAGVQCKGIIRAPFCAMVQTFSVFPLLLPKKYALGNYLPQSPSEGVAFPEMVPS